MTIRIRPKYAIPEEYDIQYPVLVKTIEPAIGSHLVTSRMGYTHHGIYIGNDKVIHYSGMADDLSFTTGAIEKTSMEAFMAGNDFTVRTYISPRFSGQDVVERAHSRLGENKYNLLSNNCEHFCEWCINEIHRSEQVEQAKTASTKGLLLYTGLRMLTPPQISIPLSIAYGAYCLLQKDKTTVDDKEIPAPQNLISGVKIEKKHS